MKNQKIKRIHKLSFLYVYLIFFGLEWFMAGAYSHGQSFNIPRQLRKKILKIFLNVYPTYLHNMCVKIFVSENMTFLCTDSSFINGHYKSLTCLFR